MLGLNSGQSVSDWERGRSESIPLGALHRLVEIYQMSPIRVYEELLAFQTKRLEEKLSSQFFGNKKTRSGSK